MKSPLDRVTHFSSAIGVTIWIAVTTVLTFSNVSAQEKKIPNVGERAASKKADADETKAREQALKSLTSKSPRDRLQAIYVLASVGVMADSAVVAARLKDDSPIVSQSASNALWQIWSRADDKAADALYEKAVGLMMTGDRNEAIAQFSELIRLKPSFAEAWNKRATLYFMTGEYQKSLADCDEVMKRNPYHFGALAGYGQIYIRLGEPNKALKYFEQALEINPTMNGLEEVIEQIKAGRIKGDEKRA